MKKKILIVIDMQNDFITEVLGNEECRKVVPNVINRMERARREGWNIICTKDTHEENYMDTGEGKRLPIKHCIRGTHGAELIDEIKAMEEWSDYDTVFLKESPLEKPAFGSTELSGILSRYDIDEIELIGVCTDICIISNAMILRSDFPDIELSVNSDCVAGVTVESHEIALKAMSGCQIAIKKENK